MSWASELRREGREEGREEGRREGWQQGQQIGLREGVLRALRLAGGDRFGPVPEDRLCALDLPALDAALRRLLTAASWDEVLAP